MYIWNSQTTKKEKNVHMNGVDVAQTCQSFFDKVLLTCGLSLISIWSDREKK